MAAHGPEPMTRKKIQESCLGTGILDFLNDFNTYQLLTALSGISAAPYHVNKPRSMVKIPADCKNRTAIMTGVT